MKIQIMKFFKDTNFQELFDSSAVLSFYFTLSIFPSLIVLISVASYLPLELINGSAIWWVDHLPGTLSNLLTDILDNVQGKKRLELLSLGFIFAIWSTSSGMVATINQLNKSYRCKETRNFLKLRGIAILLSLWLGALAIGPVILYSIGEIFLSYAPDLLNELLQQGFKLIGLRYLFMALLILSAFAGIYHIGPNKKRRFKFITAGGIFGTVMLLAGTKAFGYYIQNFSAYNDIYGSLGAGISLLIWLYLLGFFLLLGGEINQFLAKRKKNLKTIS